jgi:probable rRNA maturation factor
LEVAFVEAGECRRLHAEFFGDPGLTDVMTFPGDPADGHAGDIAICPAAAFAACRDSGLAFAAELTLYLVHAWLHLAGLDDQDPAGREEMRAAERRLMDHLDATAAILQADWGG